MIHQRQTTLPALCLISAALLTACGGDPQPEPQPDPYEQRFHPYLPLAVGASLGYNDSNVGAIDSLHRWDDELSQSAGADVYEVTFDSSDQALSFFLASDAQRIRLYGMDGPLSLDTSVGTFTLDELRFDAPIPLHTNGSNLNSGQTGARAMIRAGGVSTALSDIQIQYQTINLDTVYSGAYGTLPVRAALFNATVSGSVTTLGQTYPFDGTLDNSLLFARGIGIVRHSGTYVSEQHTYNSELIALNNLPRTIWYEYNGGSPRLASGSSSTFQINGQGPISSSDYTLANQDDINALNWIRVQESAGRYTVALPGGGLLPSETTSVEVVFEHNLTARRVSANVTLLAP